MEKICSKRLFLLLSLLLFFTLFFTDAHALDVKRKTLDNGLTLLVVERHNLPIVMVTVGIRAGSLVEPEEKAGLSNLTAELLTEGTETRTAEQISEAIEFVGGVLEASGGYDYITVRLSILKKDISLGFDLLSDIILHPLFPEKELRRKVEQMKGGLKAQGDDPGFVASKAFRREVFGRHPYGRMVEGSEETLERIERADLVNFHATHYLPNNSIISVVGDVTVEEVMTLLSKYFSEWQSGSVEFRRFRVVTDTRRRKTVLIDKELTQANIIIGHVGIDRGNPDYYAVSVMNYILGGGGFASRLMQNIREDKGLVYDVYSLFAASKYGGAFRVVFQTKNEFTNIAIEEVLKEIREIRSSLVSDAELSDAKAFLTGSFPLRIETNRRIADFLVAVEYYGLGIDYIDKYPTYINGVTKEDILRVARKYLDPERFILVVVADQEKASLKEELR